MVATTTLSAAKPSRIRLSATANASIRPSSFSPATRKRLLCTRCLNIQARHVRRKGTGLALAGSWSSGTARMMGGGVERLELLQLHQARRGFATVKAGAAPETHGPIQEYDERVHSRRLRNDEHQRGIIQHLQDLHNALRDYKPPKVVHPSLESLKPAKKTLFGSLFGGKKEEATTQLPENVPKGLYMFGDVGCGKTMLMDLFYDTLPPNVTSKTRIHFHNFMQDVHKRLHKEKMTHGNDFDAVPFIAADIADSASVLCFDEFQCTDVADAMILRRLLESLMSHGVVLVTTSNRHPNELYKNGIQRESFIPCIELLQTRLRVINLDSETDYRKIPRPPSGVYHHPLDEAATNHANKWFEYLGDFKNDPPHTAVHTVWGREIAVPSASGKAAMFEFNELIGRATGAADYLELVRRYEAFIVTKVPGMTHRERDLARRFITFIDAVYEGRAKLVLTTATPLTQLFLARSEIDNSLDPKQKSSPSSTSSKSTADDDEHAELDASMRNLMDDLGLSMSALKNTSIFSGDEERFAFARALSRLSEMGSREWVERGLAGNKGTLVGKAKSRMAEDSM